MAESGIIFDGVLGVNKAQVTSANALKVDASGTGGGAVTIADGADVAEGAKANAAVTDPTLSASLISLAKGNLTALGQVSDASVSNPASSGSIIALLKGWLTAFAARFTATATSDANRLPVDERDELAVSGSVTSAATLFTQDMLGYESITVQVTSAGSSCTITYETSDDSINWVSSAGLSAANVGGTNPAVTSTTAILLQFPKRGRYFRARVSTYGSGTVTVVGNCHKNPGVTFAGLTNAGTFSVAGVLGQGQAVAGTNIPIVVAAYSANPAAVTNAQTARPIATLIGVAIQKPYSIPEAEWQHAAVAGGIINSTTAETLKTAGAAGIKNYCTGLQIYSTALTAATEIVVRDGAAGTTIWRGFIPTQGFVNGHTVSFADPLQGTAATLMEFAAVTSAGIGSAIYVNAQGYQAP